MYPSNKDIRHATISKNSCITKPGIEHLLFLAEGFEPTTVGSKELYASYKRKKDGESQYIYPSNQGSEPDPINRIRWKISEVKISEVKISEVKISEVKFRKSNFGSQISEVHFKNSIFGSPFSEVNFRKSIFQKYIIFEIHFGS